MYVYVHGHAGKKIFNALFFFLALIKGGSRIVYPLHVSNFLHGQGEFYVRMLEAGLLLVSSDTIDLTHNSLRYTNYYKHLDTRSFGIRYLIC